MQIRHTKGMVSVQCSMENYHFHSHVCRTVLLDSTINENIAYVVVMKRLNTLAVSHAYKQIKKGIKGYLTSKAYCST